MISFFHRVTKYLLYPLKDHLSPSTLDVIDMNELLISVILRDILEINRELAIVVTSVGEFKDEVAVAALSPVLHPPLHFNLLVFS